MGNLVNTYPLSVSAERVFVYRSDYAKSVGAPLLTQGRNDQIRFDLIFQRPNKTITRLEIIKTRRSGLLIKKRSTILGKVQRTFGDKRRRKLSQRPTQTTGTRSGKKEKKH
jgi:hypothetical protein